MTELDELTAIVERGFGIRIDAERAGQAQLALGRRVAARGVTAPEYLAKLARDPEEQRALVLELTVGETYFFRHAEQIAAFAEVAVPALASRGHVRVLSAGCSTGEEPYTLAMVLHERWPRAAWRVTGVDVNRRSLEKARRGRYSRWSMRSTPPSYEARWFTSAGSEVVLAPDLGRDVRFEERNLAIDDDLFLPGRWDVVFCRNVLMYFSEASARAVLARIVRGLTPGGYLFLGHAESLRDRSEDLELCSSHDTFYYRRGPEVRDAHSTWMHQIQTATARVTALVESPPSMASLEPPDPPSLDAHIDDALAALQSGRVADAVAHGEATLAIDPAHAPAQFVLAQCRELAGDSAAAIEHARRATVLDPSFAMAHLLLGLLARRTGDRARARRELGAAIEALEVEDAARLAKFGGGLGAGSLVEMCRAELARLERG